VRSLKMKRWLAKKKGKGIIAGIIKTLSLIEEGRQWNFQRPTVTPYFKLHHGSSKRLPGSRILPKEAP